MIVKIFYFLLCILCFLPYAKSRKIELNIAISLSALINKEHYNNTITLTNINAAIIPDDNSDIILLGKQCKKKHGLTFDDLLEAIKIVSNNDSTPYLFIDVNENDINNYIDLMADFHKQSGAYEKAIVAWRKKALKRPMVVKNITPNSHIGYLLAETDILLKRFLNNEKRLKVKGLQSFTSYYSRYCQELMENGKQFDIPFINRFWLIPDSAVVCYTQNSILVPDITLKLTPEQAFMEEKMSNWGKEAKMAFSNTFNNHLAQIYHKQQLFQSTQSFFNLLLIINTIIMKKIHIKCDIDFSQTLSYTPSETFNVLDSIDGIYTDNYIDYMKMERIRIHPFSPATYHFAYIFFEGGILLNYKSITIKDTEDKYPTTVLKAVISAKPNADALFWNY